MAEIVRVRAPDGSILTIEAPDGATDEQIEAYAQSVSTGTLYVPEQRPGLPDVTLSPETAAQFTPPDVPQQPLPRAEARLTPEPSTALHAFPQAMMTELARAGQGAKAFWNLATWDLPERQQALRTMERLRGEQAERREQFPVPTLAGEVAPYLATPQPLVSSLPRAAATGGVLGSVTSGGDPWQTGLGAVGGGAGYALGRSLAAPATQLNPFQQRALAEGRAVGLRTTPAQETGGTVLGMLENSLESNILTQGATGRITAANQDTVNAIAARSIGEASSTIDDLTLGNAARRIGGVFDDIGKKVTAPIDDQFRADMAAVEDELVGSIIGTDTEEIVQSTLQRIMDRATDDTFSGEQINRFSSRLKKEARSLLRGEKRDPERAFAFNSIANALDNLLARNASARDAARLADAKTQWRNLIFLEQPGVIRGGNVSERTLANVLRRRAKAEYQRGARIGTQSPTDQLFTAARFGEAFPPLPSSGTAQRLSVPVAGSALGLGAAATGDLFTGAALGLGGPAALSMAYRRWPFATGIGLQPARRGPALGGTGARFGIGALPPFGPGSE